jgi:cytochrome c-type biogenesis protein CcmF
MAHIGLAVLFLGIIGSGRYGEKKTASLTINEPKEVLGYQLTYTGSSPTPDGKWKFSVAVARNGSQFILDPVMFESEYNNSLMRNPDYASFLTRDFYIEPVSHEEVASAALQLKKGETKTIGDATVRFVRFDMEHKGMESMAASEGFTVGAVLEVKHGTSTEQLTPVTVYKDTLAPQMRIARTKDGAFGFELLTMNVDSQTKGSVIELKVTGLGDHAPVVSQKSQLLVIEASVKPFMSLVWAGAVLMMLGLGISLSTKFNGNALGQSDAGRNKRGIS